MLSSCTAQHARHGSWPSETQARPGFVSGAQQSILDGMEGSISDYGPCPDDLDGRAAFEAVLKSEDLYILNQKNFAPYDQNLLKIAKSEVMPKKATQLLPPDAARPLLDPDKFIILR